MTTAVPVQTERLLLRPYEESDLDDMVGTYGDEAVARLLWFGVRSRAQCAQSLARKVTMTSLAGDGSAAVLALEERASGQVVGDVMVTLLSAEHGQGEVGWVVRRDRWGRGYATEAVAPLLRLAFDGHGLHRVIARLDARNTASGLFAERLGMRREAHLVHNEQVRGAWTDELVYALLAEEWREGSRLSPAARAARAHRSTAAQTALP